MFVLFIEKVTEFFKDDLGVVVTDRIQTVRNELLEQLTGIRHVEIACKCDVSTCDVALANERVIVGNTIS